MHGPTSQFYFSQRLRLHYVDWGNDAAPPLLLIHGGRDHCRNWDWVAEKLRDRFHVVAPDLRGHGDSDWANGGGYGEINYVYDIAQLVQQKRMAPVTIIAHSLGGSIALLYAGLFPETVAKVVAIEGLGPSPDMLKRIREDDIATRIRKWIEMKREAAGKLPRRYATLDAAIARMQEENKHLSAEQQIDKLSGDRDVFGDGSVIVLSTPGHTPGHQSLLVTLPKQGAVILSGDMAHFKDNWDNKRVPSMNTDKDASVASMRRVETLMAERKAQLWINHDKAQSESLPHAPAAIE
jgi:pimeloyl-ACP methyl ester carboxylesterase